MEATLEKEYTLENLCCGHCAANIEREVGSLAGVKNSSVDFVSKTLSLKVEDGEAFDSLYREIERIVKGHDSDIVLTEKIPAEPGKKTMFLSGLGAVGAAEIEAAVRGLPGVKTAGLDAGARRLTVEAEDKKKLPAVLRAVSHTVRSMAPGAAVSYAEPNAAIPEQNRRELLERTALAAGAALFAAGFWPALPVAVKFAFFLASFLLTGGEVVLRALRNLAGGRVFDEHFLMSVATVGAFAIGDFPEGAAVMLFYRVGELLQSLAVSHSRRSISALMDIRPDFANLLVEGVLRKVAPEEVGAGDRIVVKPGEKIPLDGRILEGESALDTSALTGEALPRDVRAGDEVLSGSVNKSGLLTVAVTKEFGESTVSKILDLVQNAGGRKAPTENFITKFARVYTPAVVFSALALALVPPLLLPGLPFAQWIHRGLIFLVVSCPCALVISIPLSFFGGIGGASRAGILIKGSNFLEALNRADTVAFDKTGTLTKGSFAVTRIQSANGFSEKEVLFLAAHAESFSTHPIAVSVREAYGKEPDGRLVSGLEEFPGLGMRARVDGRTVLAGNQKLMEREHIAFGEAGVPGTAVYIAADGVLAGCLVISDEIKPDSRRALERLRAAGVRKTVLLTGDSRASGERAAQELGIDDFCAELLPQQKVEKLEELAGKVAPGGKLVFVGDGINDAPVLKRADVGVAMGGLGSDAAIEAADVVLMTDEPAKLADAVRIAHKTHRIVWQNIVFALGVKGIFLVLGAFGVATMWEAVFGDVGVMVLAVLNATRAMRVPG